MGVERKGDGECLFDIEESLEELEQLADTAGLMVVGSTYQKLVILLLLIYVLLWMRLVSRSPVMLAKLNDCLMIYLQASFPKS